MERGQEKRMGSSTVASSYPKHRTLVLRVKRLQEETESDLKEKIETFKHNVKGQSPEEINKFIDETFEEAKGKMNKCFDEMKDEVKAHAPKPPEKQGKSDAQFKTEQAVYEKEKEQYKEYVATTATLMASIVDLFSSVLVKVKEFFNSLWNWIKALAKDIAKKVSSFIEWVNETINSGLSKLFG